MAKRVEHPHQHRRQRHQRQERHHHAGQLDREGELLRYVSVPAGELPQQWFGEDNARHDHEYAGDDDAGR